MVESVTTANTVFSPWSCCAQPPGSVTHPSELRTINPTWLPAVVPGTVAAALQAAGQWDIDKPLDADEEDWWYRTTFAIPHTPGGQLCYLCFDGLATLAEIWLNDDCLLTTDNMFRAYRVNVSPFLQAQNNLMIRFRSLAKELTKKRPRPHWKTKLVNHQQLRWFRTTLLGRIPGWSPPVPAVGPWRAVRLEFTGVSVSEMRVVTSLVGDTGIVIFQARVSSEAPIEQAVLNVRGQEVPIELQRDMDGWFLGAKLQVANPPLWWPHTHGKQPLFDCFVNIRTSTDRESIICGKVGFRRLEAIRDPGLGVRLNGVPVYCRGACWTTSDIVTLNGTEESLARDLRLARNAGVNMLRVGGTMVYESDRFYQLCDELGILVWQDFMFANMDYPVEDPTFAANIEAEAKYQLSRLSAHPSVTIYCGNSEVEQQAAMLGIPADLWSNDWFTNRLPTLCTENHPGTAYVPSTPSGGIMPFHVRTGISHYYGVGAYLRPPMELRNADVKFAPECLAFANIPAPESVHAIFSGNLPVLHDPQWKRRVPRDTGAGWDFDDVRDFYLQQVFGVDPVQLRCFDMPRYWQLSRVVSGEIMAQVVSEWRSGYSNNQGALVWFFKDLWPAAGWGIVDSLGLPKAAYYYLRRSWSNRQIVVTDEGLDGLHLHIINETDYTLNGYVELLLLKDQHIIVARQEARCQLACRSKQILNSDELLNGFYDVCYAYRFGPPNHDVVIATLYDDEHQVSSEAFYFVKKCDPGYLSSVQIGVAAEATGEDCFEVTLVSDRFLQNVSLGAQGFIPEDNYFHLAPARERKIRFSTCMDPLPTFKAYVEALNLREPVRIPVKNT